MAEQDVPMTVRQREQYRRNAAGQAATGAVALGAATGADKMLNDRLHERGAMGVLRASGRSVADRFRKAPKGNGFSAGTHLPHLGGKLVVRGAQVSSLPLIAVGVRGMVKPKANKKVDLRQDVIAPTIRNATLADQVQRAQERGLAKRLSPSEQERLDAHRRTGRTLSLASGTMGLSALALRAPAAAATAVRRGAKGRALVRLANQAEAATKHSNTLGVLAIGTGSAGSFNYATQQKLERKAAVTDGGVDKGAPLWAQRAANKVTKPVGRYLDRRATKVVESLTPPGGDFGNGVSVRNIRRDGTPHLGSRPMRADVHRDGVKVGELEADILPTKHVHLHTLKIDPRHQRKGTSTALMAGVQERLPKAKTPGMFFTAAQMKTEGNGADKAKGFMTWRRKGVKYVPGKAYASRPAKESLDRAYSTLPAGDAKALRRHVHRANLGVARPEAVRRMSPAVQSSMAETDWTGILPGGQPMLGKTRRAAAVGVPAAAGVAAYEHETRKSFLGEYRDRISPDAERGYRTLRAGEYEHAAQAGGNALMTGLAAWGFKHEASQPKPVNKPAIAAYLTGGALSGLGTVQAARTSARYRGKRKKIEAKARSRRAQGLYGPGRGLEPVDATSRRVGKTAGLVLPAGVAGRGLPSGARGGPGVLTSAARADNLAASVSGGPR